MESVSLVLKHYAYPLYAWQTFTIHYPGVDSKGNTHQYQASWNNSLAKLVSVTAKDISSSVPVATWLILTKVKRYLTILLLLFFFGFLPLPFNFTSSLSRRRTNPQHKSVTRTNFSVLLYLIHLFYLFYRPLVIFLFHSVRVLKSSLIVR